MTEKIQVTDTCQVRFIRIDNEPWFVLVDIAAVLDSRGSDLKKLINDTFIRKEKVLNNSGKNFPTILSNTNGIRQIYQRTRSLNLPILMNGLSHFVKDPNTIVYACKEVSWLRIIQTAFTNLKSELQYPVGEYRIDLYFPDLLVAVECDENGHSDRSDEKEQTRVEFIQDRLKCQFVRFNPDVPHFNIGEPIGQVFNIFCIRQKVKVDKINKPAIKPVKRERNLLEKACKICKIVKPLDDFNKAREHCDGREGCCRDCKEKRQQSVADKKRQALIARLSKESETKDENETKQIETETKELENETKEETKETELKDIPENYTEKTCCKCKKISPLTNYHKDKHQWDGHSTRCKDCWKARQKELKNKSVPIDVTEKKCKKCNVVRPIDQFHKQNTSSVDGRDIYCKECKSKKALEWYAKNKDKQAVNKKIWREKKKKKAEEVK